MKRHMLILAAALGGSFALAFGAEPAPARTDSRVAVTFVDPQKYTDLTREEGNATSPELLDELRDFMLETGARSVPAGMHLEIKVTDVDLAGQFEPWRGPEFSHIRIVKGLYPPRIKLEFTLTDAQGKVVSSGNRELTDLAFQTRSAFALPSDDYLRYVKDLLRQWFNSEFKPATVAGT